MGEQVAAGFIGDIAQLEEHLPMQAGGLQRVRYTLVSPLNRAQKPDLDAKIISR